MAVPAACDTPTIMARSVELAMRQHEQHVVAFGRQFEGDFTSIAEGEAQQARRLAGGDGALHAHAA